MPSKMRIAATRRAVIDIGTNSVKLLVADVAGNEVKPLLEKSEQTRLGRGFFETQQLQPESIALTARAVANFATEARPLALRSIRVIATSAARDARNQAEFLRAIEDAAGLQVEIISGEQEAKWAFAGVTSGPGFGNDLLAVLDLGGGSTEIILGESRSPYFHQSFPLGTVRLLEKIQPADPPHPRDWQRCENEISEFVNRYLRPALEPVLRHFSPRRATLIGTGGTTSILACMHLKMQSFDRDRIEAVRFAQTDVWNQQQQLWSLRLAERRQIIGLPPNRADVILMGVAIFAIVMRAFDFAELRVSTRGLRFAAIIDAEG